MLSFIELLIIILFVFLWFFVILFLRQRKQKGFLFLIFLTTFFVYLYKVLDYTLFQFQSLIVMKYFMPHLMLRGQTAGEELNLIPLVLLSAQDVQTSLLNVLLFIPFGFGVPFISELRMKNVVIAGALFSIGIEVLQFLSGKVAQVTFRIADINDVLFNTLGTLIGYLLFIQFIRVFRYKFQRRKLKNSFLRYITELPYM